jgi:hypothetical protein
MSHHKPFHVLFRLADDRDKSFLFRRSLAELRVSPAYRGVSNDTFYKYAHRALEHHLTRCPVHVAYPSGYIDENGEAVLGSSNNIVGFIVADPTNKGLIVHMLYTRRSFDKDGGITDDYRRLGIASRLVAHMRSIYELPEDLIYTFQPKMISSNEEFRERVQRDRKTAFNPFMFFTMLPAHWEQGIRAPSMGPAVDTGFAR